MHTAGELSKGAGQVQVLFDQAAGVGQSLVAGRSTVSMCRVSTCVGVVPVSAMSSSRIRVSTAMAVGRSASSRGVLPWAGKPMV
ncbi:hypothetical protein ACIO53_31140 [Streptomyces sp. NPDC087305]|uniref:hypothetical protein n=1 Tax=Streptomyces sp. NPDC087305 TaxID=3365781 RepID=UPI00381A805A